MRPPHSVLAFTECTEQSQVGLDTILLTFGDELLGALSISATCLGHVAVLCMWVFCLHVCITPCAYLVPSEARRDSQIPWDWSLR